MDSGLWRQYETEYCTKATELSNKVESLAALSPGGCLGLPQRRAAGAQGWTAAIVKS